MSNIMWTLESIQKLIELLHAHPYVWNKNMMENRQRQNREKGFKIIAKEMKMPPQVIKNKLSNLKSRYKSESTKIEWSKRLGYFYRPTLPWFNDFRDLMITAEDDNTKILNVPKQVTVEEAEDVAEQSSQEEEDDEGELEADLDNSNPDTIVVSISQDFLDGVQAENKIDFTPKPPLKRKKEISQAKLTMADVYGDEFQMFADYIADQLKKMPIELALSLQHNIQNMIEEARYEFDIID